MPSPLTVRVDDQTRQRIARIARRKRLSNSEVVRQALVAFAEKAEREEPVTKPIDLIRDLIGVVKGGDPKRSERTGAQFAKMLKERRRHG
jgi:Arc/MetJ-type ribon-helix-helix transcriptional regulator